MSVVDGIGTGFPAIGDLDMSGIFPPCKPRDKISRKQLFQQGKRDLDKKRQSARPRKHTNWAVEKLEGERTLNRVAGPKSLKRAREEGLLLCNTFVVEQISADANGEPRLKRRKIDDLSENGLNSATSVKVAMQNTGVDNLLDAAGRLRQARPQEPLELAKTDQTGAFRQCGVAPQDRQLFNSTLVAPGDKEATVWTHFVFPFGSLSAVVTYGRVSEAIVHVILMAMLVLVWHYVDDFFLVSWKKHSRSAFRMLIRLHRLIGYELAEDKTFLPRSELDILGVMVDLADAIAKVRITDLRKKVLTRVLREVLQAGSLTATLAGKLAGKLGFACQALYGRIGRAYVKELYRRQHQAGVTELTPELENALRWLLYLVQEAPPKEVVPRFMKPKNLPVIWVDAREEPKVPNAVGGVLWVPELGKKLAFAVEVPMAVQRMLNKRKKQIFMLEVLGPIIALATFLPYIKGRELFTFVDNNPATAAVGKGYSNSADATRAVSWFWLFCAKHKIAPWVLRVCSAANPSDSVSRFLFDLARKAGWGLIAAKVPQELLIKLLGAPNGDQALRDALSSLGERPLVIPVPAKVKDLEWLDDRSHAAQHHAQAQTAARHEQAEANPSVASEGEAPHQTEETPTVEATAPLEAEEKARSEDQGTKK
jgi:uncharacterized membrane protein